MSDQSSESAFVFITVIEKLDTRGLLKLLCAEKDKNSSGSKILWRTIKKLYEYFEIFASGLLIILNTKWTFDAFKRLWSCQIWEGFVFSGKNQTQSKDAFSI